MTTDQLRKQIAHANQAYRVGEAIMSDTEYDNLLQQLAEQTQGQDELIDKIGFDIAQDDSRKETLPVPMYSMNKVKTMEELEKWAELKGISPQTEVVITPKFDGLSLCVNEKTGDAWTRGNGLQGQRANEHYKTLMSNKKNIAKQHVEGYTLGEVIMKKNTFAELWASQFKNSRNMGAGALNRKEADPMLTDFDFMRYAIEPFDAKTNDKIDQIDHLNQYFNDPKVESHCCQLGEITTELLQKLFADFGKNYELDGLIVEVNKAIMRDDLGRETNKNPAYARAWKGFLASERSTTIKNIVYQISKFGLMKPVAQIEPVELDGVTVSNVTLINARFIKDSQIGIGSKVLVIRSGQVIPKIIAVIEPAEPTLPTHCPSCGTVLVWNANQIELLCPNIQHCDGQKLQKIIAFFNILEVENLAEGTLEQIYKTHDTVEKILNMTVNDFEQLDHFKNLKAKKIFRAIQDKTQDIPLEKLMHATSLFEGLGSKKLALLTPRYNAPDHSPSVETITQIDGFSEITARIFVENYKRFWQYIGNMPLKIKKNKQKIINSNLFEGLNVCFTGFRDQDIETFLEQNGGKTASGITKNTTHLVMKQLGSGSSKEQKAQDLNIPIFDAQTFKTWIENFLNEQKKE